MFATPEKARRARGFTLVELLTVIAVIVILAAITLGVSAGVRNKQAEAKATAEMQALMTALEEYKNDYGDYPPESVGLHRALIEGVRPDGTEPASDRAYIETDRFDVYNTSGSADTINDPWGEPYLYYYKDNPGNSGGWDRPGYLLYSKGPDGNFAATGFNPATGIISDQTAFKDAPQNLDNLAARR